MDWTCTLNNVVVECPNFIKNYGGLIFAGFFVFVCLLIAIPLWRIFTKAGESGWKSLIPVYNIMIFLKIINKPAWWIILFFIPFVNFVIYIIAMIELAKVFGKGTGFTVGLVLLSYIFLIILAFGSAQYIGKDSVSVPVPPVPNV